jgi:hypothetical protein
VVLLQLLFDEVGQKLGQQVDPHGAQRRQARAPHRREPARPQRTHQR